MAVVVAAVGGNTPAHGQNADGLFYGFDASAQCVARAAEPQARQLCIGTSADVCMADTPGGYSTYAMGGCLSLELDDWDARLNAAYQQARTEAARQDKAEPMPYPRAEALRDMQRAWIPFRDATCSYEAAQWGGGTGATPAFLGCLLRLTGQQALYLELGGVGG